MTRPVIKCNTVDCSPILAAHIGRQPEGGWAAWNCVSAMSRRAGSVMSANVFVILRNHSPQLREITVEANHLGAFKVSLSNFGDVLCPDRAHGVRDWRLLWPKEISLLQFYDHL